MKLVMKLKVMRQKKEGKMSKENPILTRRQFLKGGAATIAGLGTSAILAKIVHAQDENKIEIENFFDGPDTNAADSILLAFGAVQDNKGKFITKNYQNYYIDNDTPIVIAPIVYDDIEKHVNEKAEICGAHGNGRVKEALKIVKDLSSHKEKIIAMGYRLYENSTVISSVVMILAAEENKPVIFYLNNPNGINGNGLPENTNPGTAFRKNNWKQNFDKFIDADSPSAKYKRNELINWTDKNLKTETCSDNKPAVPAAQPQPSDERERVGSQAAEISTEMPAGLAFGAGVIATGALLMVAFRSKGSSRSTRTA